MRTLPKLLVAAVLASATSADAALYTNALDNASGFNVFTLGSFTQSNASIEGRVAAGGTATFSAVSIGTSIAGTASGVTTTGGLSVTGGTLNGTARVGGNAAFDNASASGYISVKGSLTNTNWGSFAKDLRVDGSVNATTLSVTGAISAGGNFTVSSSGSIGGALHVGGAADLKSTDVTGIMRVNGNTNITGSSNVGGGLQYGGSYSGKGSISRSSVANSANLTAADALDVDIAATGATLKTRSAYWGTLSATGTSNLSGSTRTLTGASSSLNIFNLTASAFSGVTSFAINVPAGSTVLVNITGSSVSLPNIGYTLNGSSLSSSGTDVSKLLWNITSATSLTHFSFGGSILAPYADATFASGTFNGTAIANSYANTYGSFTADAFTGGLPSNVTVPEPTSLALLAPAGLMLRRRRR